MESVVSTRLLEFSVLGVVVQDHLLKKSSDLHPQGLEGLAHHVGLLETLGPHPLHRFINPLQRKATRTAS